MDKRSLILVVMATAIAVVVNGTALAFTSPISPIAPTPLPERVPDDPGEYLDWCTAHCQADYGGSGEYDHCVRYCKHTAAGKCAEQCTGGDCEAECWPRFYPQPTPTPLSTKAKPKPREPEATATATLPPTATPAPTPMVTLTTCPEENANEAGGKPW